MNGYKFIDYSRTMERSAGRAFVPTACRRLKAFPLSEEGYGTSSGGNINVIEILFPKNAAAGRFSAILLWIPQTL